MNKIISLSLLTFILTACVSNMPPSMTKVKDELQDLHKIMKQDPKLVCDVLVNQGKGFHRTSDGYCSKNY